MACTGCRKKGRMSATPVPPKIKIRGAGVGTGVHPMGYNTSGKAKIKRK